MALLGQSSEERFMWRVFWMFAPLLFSAGCISAPGSESRTGPGHPLGWLEGCWDTGNGTQEVWVLASDYLFGFSTVEKDGRAVFFEQLRIEPTEQDFAYVASPRGGASVRFDLVAEAGASATFENPEHDHPQRIRYRLDGDELVAEISLLDGTRAGNWRYRSCSGERAGPRGNAPS